jgi:hypothetical protein
MRRRYEIVILVGVEDNDPSAECTSDDPTNHQGDTCPVHEVMTRESLEYRAFEEARRTITENEADWYAREVT